MKNIRYVLIGFCSLMVQVAMSQKLPNKQTASVWLPAAAKIDGKATEWNDEYQAQNAATEVLYTMANDAQNIYFIVKTSKPVIARKILQNGITISINPGLSKDLKTAVSITYPCVRRTLAAVANKLKDKAPAIDGAELNLINQQIAENAKDLQLKKSKQTVDTISIYNDLGINTGVLVGADKLLTFEILLPIKSFGLDENSKGFSYNIIINGRANNGVTTVMSADGRAVRMGDPGQTMVELVLPPDELGFYFPTDFWGEYTLARKP